ncbi:RpiB/LacA/LacB family sugar-phosphate isomerase [Patescibacteria group bacterium]|nr:RpiB/LacA/LacB family sugar-phosphate isomerase [Patescibacteria group bacterium]MBU1705615.1 RpiB/LacA/LacB family sugar-phosphate isomerase [Patescibacteria group bacterium]
MKPTIYLGADHAGWKLKEGVEEYLKELGYQVVDMGNENLVEDDDYPDFGYAVAKRVATDVAARGLVFCGNAQGVCIVANKVRGIRAATGFNEEAAETSRSDDDSNILCLPGRMMELKEAKKIIDKWLATPFSDAARHQRRLKKVTEIEDQEFNP